MVSITTFCTEKTLVTVSRYDALTTSNEISYQNALNDHNFRFAEACEGMLTNYCWTEADAEKSIQFALSSRLLPQNIYFGIDVWAQNKSSFTHPRVTFPKYGGGGTNTGIAVAKLAELGLSAGIFAPAWSFEHFSGNGRGIERVMWEGDSFPTGIDCSCGDCASRHSPNEQFAVIKYARERAAGSETFFYTDFSRAFATHGDELKDLYDGNYIHAQLGTQSILPRPTTTRDNNQAIQLSHRLETVDNRTRLVIESTQTKPVEGEFPEQWLPLYKLDMAVYPLLSIRYNMSLTSSAVVSMYCKTTAGVSQVTFEAIGDGVRSTGMVLSRRANARIQELGIVLEKAPTSAVGETTRLVELLEISILPRPAGQDLWLADGIKNIRSEHRGEGQKLHTKLCWEYEDTASPGGAMEGMPYSETTGPFSHFDVQVDDFYLGRAYALQHILNEKLVERINGRYVDVLIMGISFSGRRIAGSRSQLRL
jgi:hypothetical protein